MAALPLQLASPVPNSRRAKGRSYSILLTMKNLSLLQQTAPLEPGGPLQLSLLRHPLLLPEDPVLTFVPQLALAALVKAV